MLLIGAQRENWVVHCICAADNDMNRNTKYKREEQLTVCWQRIQRNRENRTSLQPLIVDCDLNYRIETTSAYARCNPDTVYSVCVYANRRYGIFNKKKILVFRTQKVLADCQYVLFSRTQICTFCRNELFFSVDFQEIIFFFFVFLVAINSVSNFQQMIDVF